jgi:hypothetical protein
MAFLECLSVDVRLFINKSREVYLNSVSGASEMSESTSE